MPRECTVSVVRGEGAIKHNNREYGEGKTPDHIDKGRANLNYYIKTEPIGEAYENLFGEAIREYDLNQKRADRRYGSTAKYLDKMERSKQQKPFDEIIIQFGDMFSHGILPREQGKGINAEADEAKIMLIEAYKRFEAAYPNLYFFNVTLHMDEATPHIHADYIPYADFGKGLKRRVALDKGLQAMGFKPSATAKTPLEAWQQDTRRIMTEVAREHGYKVIETGGKTLHRSVEAYKRDVAELDRKIERQAVPEITKTPIPLTKDKVIVPVAELEKLEEVARMRVEQRAIMDKAIDHAEALTAECEDYLERVKPLDRIRRKAIKILRGDLVKDLKAKVEELEGKVANLKTKVADLTNRLANSISIPEHNDEIRRVRLEKTKGMIPETVAEAEKAEAVKKAEEKGFEEGFDEGFDDVKEWLSARFGDDKEIRDEFEYRFKIPLNDTPPTQNRYR